MDKIILWLILFGILAGQVLQVQLVGIDVPIIDIAIGLGLIGLLAINRNRIKSLKTLPLFWPTSIFAGALTISLLVNLNNLTLASTLVSGLYLARTLAYLLFGLLLAITSLKDINYYWKSILSCGLLLALIGFLQLAIFPDFQIFDHFGWDPHQGRLIGSFLDPNYTATWLSLVIILGSVIILQRSSLLEKLPTVLNTGSMLLAHLLTLSRSGLLALAAGLAFLSWNKSKLLTLGFGLLAVVAIFLSPRLQDRISGIWQIDATVRYRLESWETGGMLYLNNPVFGIGYNTLKYRRYEDALPGTFRITSGQVADNEEAGSRADTGFDSSLLTIAATSGTIGLLAFIWLIIKSLLLSWSNIKRKTYHIYSLWFLGATCSLLIGSLFINAWLYSPILILWVIAMALIQKEHAN